MSPYVCVVEILPERLQTAEIGVEKKRNQDLVLLIYLVSHSPLYRGSGQPTWYLFISLKQESHRTTRWLGFFPFRERNLIFVF